MQHVNSGLENEPGASSSLGHIHVCVLCGSSLRNRKHDLIVRENPSQLQQAIQIELENRIAPRQVIMICLLCPFFFVFYCCVIVNLSLRSNIVL